ncbi:glutamine amidotransferase [Aureitalea sp. L0-47]|uniref:glutamine amidotransferase n=1 Tax=Aureitalea sp. L0-47 TaxID=2816962 RepID=UPI00223885E7|nr:glutamine amidotransferase [Aureitalea sp. L0-47]MCW5518755.1 glutamine amidotransferase [Aureitalea sp. L0-47]
MKKFLVLQLRPEDEAADSEFESILKVGNIDRERAYRIRVEQESHTNIDLSNYCAIIAGGSPFDVSIPRDSKSDVQLEVESFFHRLFDQVVPADFPFLGACSGNGLLGRYCGTTISGKYAEDVGIVPITLTEEAQHDDLLKGLPKEFGVLVGHKEACDQVPENAVLLASSKQCPVQMFRLKNNIYATQFHPEANANEFVIRIRIYKNHGYFPPEKADELIDNFRGVETPHANQLLQRFVEKYR